MPRIPEETRQRVRAMRAARCSLDEIRAETGVNHNSVIAIAGRKPRSETTLLRLLGHRMGWEYLSREAMEWLLKETKGNETPALCAARMLEALAKTAGDDPAGHGDQEGTGEGA